jgi:choline dehydrogenase
MYDDAFRSRFKTRSDLDLDSDREPGLGGRRPYLPQGRMLGARPGPHGLRLG